MAANTHRVTANLSAQYQGAHMLLEATMADVTTEQAHWSPPGKALPLGANYAHIVTSEDSAINGLIRGVAPLAATTWAGKTGLSEMPPQGRVTEQWARSLRVDLPALRSYAQAVYANTTQYLSTLSDEDLNRPLDLTSLGVGQQTVGWMLNVMLGNVDHHCGEISCLKGLQGLKGYPM